MMMMIPFQFVQNCTIAMPQFDGILSSFSSSITEIPFSIRCPIQNRQTVLVAPTAIAIATVQQRFIGDEAIMCNPTNSNVATFSTLK